MSMEGGGGAATRPRNVNHPRCVVLKFLVVMSDLLADNRVFIGTLSVLMVQSILAESACGSGVWVTEPLI